MMLKNVLLTGAATLALAAVAIPAHADNIVENQWYAGHFLGTPSPLLGNGSPGTHGPILPNGSFANAIPAPPTTGGALNAIITLSKPEWLTVTDVETSGDQFQILDNGAPATLAPSHANGLTPGGQQSYNGVDIKGTTLSGLTSLPVPNAALGANISTALGNPDYSSGTFLLPAGVNVITGEFLGVIGFGDMDFIVTSPVPEPATLSILGFGLAGLGLLRYRRGRTPTG